MARFEFMLLDKKGELYVAGEIGRELNGQFHPVMDGHEILHNVRTHEMSEFKLTPEYEGWDIEETDCLKLPGGRTIYG